VTVWASCFAAPLIIRLHSTGIALSAGGCHPGPCGLRPAMTINM
jgi:hypothetical protein